MGKEFSVFIRVRQAAMMGGREAHRYSERETKEALRFTDTHSLSRSQWRVLEGGLRSPVWYKAEVAERVQAESLPRRWRAASLVTSCRILPVQRSSKRRVRAWLLEFAVQLAVSFCNRNMKNEVRVETIKKKQQSKNETSVG